MLCGPRKIQPDDEPVFADKDSEGNEIPARCYCKQMDVDVHVKRCMKPAEQKVEEGEAEVDGAVTQ